jgi:hypothetical protein
VVAVVPGDRESPITRYHGWLALSPHAKSVRSIGSDRTRTIRALGEQLVAIRPVSLDVLDAVPVAVSAGMP